MYSAVTNHRQESRFKLITVVLMKEVVGLHGLGYEWMMR